MSFAISDGDRNRHPVKETAGAGFGRVHLAMGFEPDDSDVGGAEAR